MRPAPEFVAKQVADRRFPDAACVLMAGSIARGQATATSDIDLVVIHRHLSAAWRESLLEQNWPMEAFAHDLHTLQYFFDQVDAPSGLPSLASMVSEGLLIAGDEALAKQAKAMAQAALKRGPPAWDDAARRASRYAITDIIDDIRAPATRHTLNAALAQLYPALANHYLRSRNQWSAKGKTLPRRLAQLDSDYADHYCAAFEQAFGQGETAALIALAEQTLQTDGGWLFAGHQLAAPEAWRSEPVFS
ncbi:nucleotidyltransferase domain-containing protein [Chromobacterium sp. IIBBL 290-4]|uniref:nucleotidyltransferase domain-containing protein n=1 Tax=Chromobacterium sp. IIBBL 290-4 TaxID=2953890 RepID=UPI0020B8183F|nr:nucleotidyltransferase domain-containing protein [Chromobacterium sp. IIBBL 290-4]UTH72388.1 nucleotidyltransferase domain-containing protein [Chromobacterium sp. IIBBL 290-4]